MEPACDVAASENLKLLPCLEQQMALWDCNAQSLAVPQPNEQARIAVLAVNCQEIQIVMEAGKDGSHRVALQIGASGR